MTTINTTIQTALEYNKLNEQYGFLSCFDYPQQYNIMDELQCELSKQIEVLTNDNDISINGLTQAVENVASDIYNNNLSQDATLTLYTQDEFIEQLASNMTRKEAERFKDMLSWMQEKDRAGYLETKFILEFENDNKNKKSYYHDNRMSFIIVAE